MGTESSEPDDEDEFADWLAGKGGAIFSMDDAWVSCPRHRLATMPDTELVILGATATVCAAIRWTAGSHADRYVALIRNTVPGTRRTGRHTFSTPGRTLELDPYVPIDDDTLAALVAEIGQHL